MESADQQQRNDGLYEKSSIGTRWTLRMWRWLCIHSLIPSLKRHIGGNWRCSQFCRRMKLWWQISKLFSLWIQMKTRRLKRNLSWKKRNRNSYDFCQSLIVDLVFGWQEKYQHWYRSQQSQGRLCNSSKGVVTDEAWTCGNCARDSWISPCRSSYNWGYSSCQSVQWTWKPVGSGIHKKCE